MRMKRRREKNKIPILYSYNKEIKEMPLYGNLYIAMAVSKIRDFSIENTLYGLSVN